MDIRKYIDPVFIVNYNEVNDKNLNELIYHMLEKNYERMYLIKDNKPYGVISPIELLKFCVMNEKIDNLISTDLYILEASTNIIDAYNKMRRDRVRFAVVVDNGKIIGEIDFKTLSLKISYLVIKDSLTYVFNERFFSIVIEEYTHIDKPIGVIMIKIENLSIYDSLYGSEFVTNTYKKFAETIQHSRRDIDFVFRDDNIFKVLTFNNLEITVKIVERIKHNLENIEIEGIKVPFKIVFSHVPEIKSSILLAIEDCEKQLVEWD
jgi:diguanylate cyclase (GGDEF)-like protein